MKRKISLLLCAVMIVSAFSMIPSSLVAQAEGAKAQDINAACGKTVTASSEADSDDGFPGNCTDMKLGSSDRKFSTLPKSKQGAEWIEVDLVAEYNISSIGLNFCAKGQGAPKDFRIQIWNGKKWTTVTEEKGYQAPSGWIFFDLANYTNGSKVRLYADKLSKVEGKYVLQLMEIYVLGYASGNYYAPISGATPDNIAWHAAVNTSDCYEEADLATNKLTDGGFDGIYTSNNFKKAKNTSWIEVLLDGVYSIDSVTLYPRYIDQALAFPKDFTISVWNEGKWTTVVKKAGYTKPADDTGEMFQFSPTLGSRIRVTTTQMGMDDNNEYYVQLAEMEATGKFKKELKTVSVDRSSTGNHTQQIQFDPANDLALYMPTTASTDLAMYQAGADKMTDGDITTHYSSDEGLTQAGVEEWAEVNLLENYKINKVILYAREYGWGFPKNFTISVYYNNEWTEVVKERDYKIDAVDAVTAHEFSFPETVGSKVMISATEFGTTDMGLQGLQLKEMAIYGKKAEGDYIVPVNNIISDATILSTSTSVEDYGYFKAFLTDNNVETTYSSKQYDSATQNEWIELDFKRDMKIREVQLKPFWGGNGFPVDFKISVLENGKWVDALTVQDYEQPVNEAWQKFILDRECYGQKLKITVTKLGTDFGQYSLKLNEIKVYTAETGDGVEGGVPITDNQVVTYNTAEKVSETKKVSKVLIFVGGGLVLLSILGGAIYYKLLSAKIKKRRDGDE